MCFVFPRKVRPVYVRKSLAAFVARGKSPENGAQLHPRFGVDSLNGATCEPSTNKVAMSRYSPSILFVDLGANY